MIEIIPAILPASYSELEEKLAAIHHEVKKVQIDIVDGVFAPNKTWPYVDGEMFERLRSQEEGLPFWEELDFQFDLMVSNATKAASDYLTIGASSVVVHHAGEGTNALLESLQSARGGELGVEVGLALLPEESAATLSQYREYIDFVQVMGISRVGFQGSAFNPKALDLISSLRANDQTLVIQIDGGVTLENAQHIAHAGANRLVVGSAIFGGADPTERYRSFVEKTRT